jgi:hypothetical protein
MENSIIETAGQLTELTPEPTTKTRDPRGRHPRGCDCGRCVWSKGKVKSEPKPEFVKHNESSTHDFGGVHESAKTHSSIDEMLAAYNVEHDKRESGNNAGAGDGVIIEGIETIEPPTQEEPTPEAKAISGAFLLTVINVLFPWVIAGVYNWNAQNKRKPKIDIKDLQLDDEQREILEESADEIAQLYLKKFPPLVLFGINLATFYAANLKTAIDASKKRKKSKDDK